MQLARGHWPWLYQHDFDFNSQSGSQSNYALSHLGDHFTTECAKESMWIDRLQSTRFRVSGYVLELYNHTRPLSNGRFAN